MCIVSFLWLSLGKLLYECSGCGNENVNILIYTCIPKLISLYAELMFANAKIKFALCGLI